VYTVSVFYMFAMILVVTRVAGFALFGLKVTDSQLAESIFVIAAFAKYCVDIFQCVS